LLDFLDLLGQRRLGHMLVRCRAREISCPGDCAKISELMHFHYFAPPACATPPIDDTYQSETNKVFLLSHSARYPSQSGT